MTGQGRVGLLPAAFNPPTNAHLGLAHAAQRQMELDGIVFVLPQVLPHKEFDGTEFNQRLSLLDAAIEGHPAWSSWTSNGGLFLEIAREFHALQAGAVEIYMLCGRDAAQRIVNWDYGAGPSIAEQLREFQMLVAARRGNYEPPPELAARIHPVALDDTLQSISSSQVRQAIATGKPWKHLVPPAVARQIEAEDLYR